MAKKIQRAKKARQAKKQRQANKQQLRLPLLILGVVLILGAYHLTKPSTPDSISNIRYEMASWPIFYDSVEELARAPRVDAIVRGVIIAAELFEDPVEDGSGHSLITTLFSFKVHRVLKGPHNLEVIEIYQSGGILNGRTVMILDDPLMQVGDVLILFLHSGEHHGEPGKYAVEGGPQGRFIVKGGRVFALGEIPGSADERVQREINASTKHLHTGGINEAEFIQQVQAALSTK